MRVFLTILFVAVFAAVAPVAVQADGYSRAGQPAKSDEAGDAAPTQTTKVYALPARSDSMLDFAAELMGKGKYAQSISVLEDVLKRNPANPDALAYLGFANMQLGDLDVAEAKLRLALKIDGRHLGANQHLGEVYAKRGKTARALDQLTVLKMLCRTSCPEKEALEAAINTASKG